MKIYHYWVFILMLNLFALNISAEIDSPNPCSKCLKFNALEYYEFKIHALDSLVEEGSLEKYDYLVEKGMLYHCMVNANPNSKYFSLAKHLFLEAINLEPSLPEAYNKIAVLYLLYFDPPKAYLDTAFSYVNKALILSSPTAESFFVAGQVYFFRMEYKRAMKYFKIADKKGVCDQSGLNLLIISSHISRGHFEKGFLLYKEKEYQNDKYYVFPSFVANYILNRNPKLFKKLKRFFKKLDKESPLSEYAEILDMYKR